MSVYFTKGKGWRYDFMIEGRRFTGTWFKTKREARKAESDRRKEVLGASREAEMPIDMTFLGLVSRRLDHVEAYNSKRHYDDCRYVARRWARQWRTLRCGEITPGMVQAFVLRRAKVSPNTANKEIRYLKALFNFGKKKGWITDNPVQGIGFLPTERRHRYVPTPLEVDNVISVADKDVADYLWTIRETMARVSEINRLTWNDVNFELGYVVLYTRKKKGGHLTPRKVPMTQRLARTLWRRYEEREPSKPWVFWHEYWSSKKGEKLKGPYQPLRRLMP